ncbi:MAG: RNA-binding protein [Candidatus Paceibacterota bacterium]
MAKKLYVGGLAWATTNDSLKQAFAQYGEVEDVQVITDKMTGKSRGFGFVTMVDDGAAEQAIQTLNGAELDGRNITVNEARPKSDRPMAPRGGSRGGFGGGYDRGGDRRDQRRSY